MSRLPIPRPLRDAVIDVPSGIFETSEFLEVASSWGTEDIEGSLRTASVLYASLPKELRRRILDFRLDSNSSGAVLFRGLPEQSNLPMTPSDPLLHPRRRRYEAEAAIALLSSGFGDLVGYRPEKQGQIIQNLVPVQANATKLSSESSTILLDFHTESAFHPYLPDYLFLLALRADHDRTAHTFVAGVDQIIRSLDVSTIQTLRQPLFHTGIDFSFGNTDLSRDKGPVVPVLYGNNERPFFTYDLDLMTGTTSEATRALDKVRSAAYDAKVGIVLEPGHLLVIDSRRAIHGRSSFRARYDGDDRWLLRSSAVASLRPSSAERELGSRVIETVF